MAVIGVTKWPCPTCTYSNWSTSLKCTLCGSPRPNEVSRQWTSSRKHSPSSTPTYGGELSNAHSPEINYKNWLSSDISSHHKASKCKAKAKWACTTCTYTNWANAHQCVMCGTQKSKVKVESSNETNRSYPISESILEYASSKGAVGGACVQEERVIPQVKPSRIKKESKNGKSNLDKKWKCQQCTFDNYTKSAKCAMCHARRTPSPVYEDRPTPSPPSQHTPSTRHTLLRTPPLNANKTAVKSTPSPPSFPKPLSSTATLNDKNCLKDSDNALVEEVESLEVTRSSLVKSDSNQVRQIRNRLTNSDWLFLNACLGVVNGEMSAVKPYLRQVGDRARQLTKDECLVIGHRHSLGVGSTLVHLAIRFQRSELLSLLLTPASSEARKRLPSETSPDLAASIRKEFALSLWQHKGEWAVYFVTQLTTFTLPSDIRKFCLPVQKKVLDDVVDRDVEQELAEGDIINWSSEVVGELGSKLHPLWNRTAGDCLLDSVLQATWGVMDREATLRRAMADSLTDGASRLYDRWKESEQRLSMAQGYSLDEEQLRQDWEAVLTLADQPGRALEQAHIFVLAHLLRRPIVVYGVRVVKNYRGENLGFANFEGVYLPLLWEPSFCWKTPIAMAYTRGHFSALVAMTTQQPSGAGVQSNVSHDNHVTSLPLTDSDGHLLQLHFLTEQELGSEERLLNEYCDCHITRLGTLTARQEVLPGQQPTLMVQLIEEWLDRYRRLDKRQGSSSACVHYPES